MAATEKKTPKKADNKPAKASRFRPVRYLKEVQGELKKVTWPTMKELTSHTAAVFAFLIGMAIVIGVLDLIFSQGTGLLAGIGKTPVL